MKMQENYYKFQNCGNLFQNKHLMWIPTKDEALCDCTDLTLMKSDPLPSMPTSQGYTDSVTYQ